MRRVLRIATLVALVAWMAGCAGQRARQPGTEPSPGIQDAPGGLKFSVKVTPTRFRLGERVVLEATMFNDSDRRYYEEFPTACVFDYEIAADARVLGPERMCAQAITDVVLEPGELRMIMREWSGRQRYFDTREPLAPGT